MWVMKDRTKSTNKIYRLEAQRDLARFKSAGGDMGATYLVRAGAERVQV